MDLWFNSTPVTDDQPDGTEIMIWLNHRGGVQPIGSRTATVQLGGLAWDVWTGNGAPGWKVISYVLQGGATSFTDLDVKSLIDDAVTRGSLNAAHYLIDAEAGFEIWQGGQGLGTNSFSFTAGTDSGGPGDALAPTTPTGLQVTGSPAARRPCPGRPRRTTPASRRTTCSGAAHGSARPAQPPSATRDLPHPPPTATR
jgi:hypothetical protein